MRRVLNPYTDHTFLNCYADDFTGDGKSDLLIHNDNSILLYRSNGSNWSNADGKADLFVYNYQDWSTQYLGRMISEGTTLAADWVADWVGEWNLGAVDQFAPCDARGRQ